VCSFISNSHPVDWRQVVSVLVLTEVYIAQLLPQQLLEM
jgi:hypothetical protein